MKAVAQVAVSMTSLHAKNQRLGQELGREQQGLWWESGGEGEAG